MPMRAPTSRNVRSASPFSRAMAHAASRISSRVAVRRSIFLSRVGFSNIVRSLLRRATVVKGSCCKNRDAPPKGDTGTEPWLDRTVAAGHLETATAVSWVALSYECDAGAVPFPIGDPLQQEDRSSMHHPRAAVNEPVYDGDGFAPVSQTRRNGDQVCVIVSDLVGGPTELVGSVARVMIGIGRVCEAEQTAPPPYGSFLQMAALRVIYGPTPDRAPADRARAQFDRSCLGRIVEPPWVCQSNRCNSHGPGPRPRRRVWAADRRTSRSHA